MKLHSQTRPPYGFKMAATIAYLKHAEHLISGKSECLFQYSQQRFHCVSLVDISPHDLMAKGKQCAN